MNITLLILQLMLAVVALLKDEIFPEEKLKRKSVIVIMTLIFIIFFLQISIQLEEDFKNKYDGTLESPIASNVQFAVLRWGDSKLRNIGDFIPELKDNPVMQFMNDDKIKIDITKGKANFSMKIRNGEGNEIGEIINNKWRIYSPQLIMDRNFNSNSLEIKDLKGKIVFQVQICGNEIKIGDVIYNERGKKFTAPNYNEYRPQESLFKYPSTEYPRELNNKQICIQS